MVKIAACLKWIFERCDGKVHAKETPIGRIPEVADLDTTGLDIQGAHVGELVSVDIEGWLAEVPLMLRNTSPTSAAICRKG